MDYTKKEKLNRFLGNVVFGLKFLIFFCLIYTSVVLYQIHNIYLANDVIIMAAIFIILNKIDR